MEGCFYVYTHTRPDTGEVFYVGKGKLSRYRETNGRSAHWKDVVKRNNGSFTIKIVCENLIEEDAVLHEEYLILLYGREDLRLGCLVNKRDRATRRYISKKVNIRLSGYYPEAVIQAIKTMAEKEGLSENEAATKLLEAGIAVLKPMADIAKPPPGLKGIELTIWKAEQKAKK